MSSLGFQLVYHILGQCEDLVCERFFLPSRGESLRSVESQRSMTDFPILFISISFEHDYLNLVRMLEGGGVPVYAHERSETISGGQPLVICGGVATAMNPEPLAPFVDLFIVGEAEPVLDSVVERLVGDYQRQGRSELLQSFAESDLPGCYVPSRYVPHYKDNGTFSHFSSSQGELRRIKKGYLKESDVASHSQLISPDAEFSEMHLTELGRGCSRGCRFCAAGFIYRPPRLWDGEAIVKGLKKRMEGVDKVGLLGMEMADRKSLAEISSYLKESGCALSFSSLRADRLSDDLLELLSASDLKSVAIAPDGSSERLRCVINKGLKESDLLNAAGLLVRGGIYKLKIYLMLGLPTETDEDLGEAIELIGKIKEVIDPIGRERGRLTEIYLSVNCFAPKPWTPFQYHPFGLSEQLPSGTFGDARAAVIELKRRQKFIKKGLASYKNVHVHFDKPETVLFQAVLSRGDRRLGPVLVEMARTGRSWKQVMKSHGLTAEQFALSGAGESDTFPWYIIDHGIEEKYLWYEYLRAFDEKLTVACDTAVCRRCGVCHD